MLLLLTTSRTADRCKIVDPEAALARDGYHDELDQVEKDVERSMWRWGTCEHEYHVRPPPTAVECHD